MDFESCAGLCACGSRPSMGGSIAFVLDACGGNEHDAEI
jgi:hypothetical protein